MPLRGCSLPHWVALEGQRDAQRGERSVGPFGLGLLMIAALFRFYGRTCRAFAGLEVVPAPDADESVRRIEDAGDDGATGTGIEAARPRQDLFDLRRVMPQEPGRRPPAGRSGGTALVGQCLPRRR